VIGLEVKRPQVLCTAVWWDDLVTRAVISPLTRWKLAAVARVAARRGEGWCR
jgi:hypothetical protein